MSKVTLTLEGLDALKAAVARQPDAVRVHLGGVVQSTAFGVAQRARMFARAYRDTGALEASIESKASGLSGRVLVKPGTIQGRQPEIYWRFNEYGTVNMPARPLFRASAEAESAQMESRVRAIVPKLERDFASGRFT